MSGGKQEEDVRTWTGWLFEQFPPAFAQRCLTKYSLVVVYFKLVLTAILWGGTFIAGRVIALHVNPFSAAFFRFAIASVFLVGITWRQEKRFPLPKKHQVIPIVLLGMTGIFTYNFFFFTGLKLIEAGRASVIIANNPIFIALLSAYFFKEKLTPLKITGILLSVTGAIIVVTRGQLQELLHGNIGLGELYILCCVASWVTYSLLGKALMKDLSPLLSVTYSVLVGTIALIIPACLEGVLHTFLSYSAPVWVSLFYLGFFGTVLGFIWYYQGIQRIGPMKAGLFLNFVPVSGVLLSALLLGESITSSLLLGMLFVSSGVYLTNRRPQAD